jgi:N-acetyltransferase 10
MSMDVHSRFRINENFDFVPRFNERFLLSLATCRNCLVLDDQLNILPLSNHIKDIKPVIIDNSRNENHIISKNETDLLELTSSLKDVKPTGPLIKIAKTLDQANALLEFIDSISSKTLQHTISLTASRGRGKSAALGLAISAAGIIIFF